FPPLAGMRAWRNWQTRTVQGRVSNIMEVQPLLPAPINCNFVINYHRLPATAGAVLKINAQ
ncbi:MAG TPA: hypothetical protein PKK37_03605, partial [Candidatus Pacearchaeota archaeon]|nr:hypothetical protein [Candidatus Pacearchaeota archaeon]